MTPFVLLINLVLLPVSLFMRSLLPVKCWCIDIIEPMCWINVYTDVIHVPLTR